MDTVGRLTVAAQQNHKQGLPETGLQTVRNIMKKLCRQLWRQRHQLEAQHVTTVLTALSRTDQQLDTMPGLADALAEQFIADVDCHNAHRFANTLYSCSLLKIHPCDGQLVKHILQRLPKLSLASFNARHVANALHGVAQLPTSDHPAAVIDKLSNRLIRLMGSSQPDERPTEDDTASFLRSLRTLQHQPKPEFAAAFVTWYTQLLTELQNQSPPRPGQRTGIILTACANLRLDIPHSFTPVVLPHVYAVKDRSHPTGAKAKACANASWALAALGALDLHTFKSLLSKEPQSSPWSVADLVQLHRALDWLQFESADHAGHHECLQLREQLACLPAHLQSNEEPQLGPAVAMILTVLTQYGVRCATNVQLGGYIVPVVVEEPGRTEMAVGTAVDVVGTDEIFRNQPER